MFMTLLIACLSVYYFFRHFLYIGLYHFPLMKRP